MDCDTIERMITNLEILGALEQQGCRPATPEDLGNPGADESLTSLECHEAPGSLMDLVLARIDSAPARVTTDREGCITSINPTFSRLCGFSFHEIRGRKPGSFLQGEETNPVDVELIRQAVRCGNPCVTELVNYHKDGTRYRVRIEMRPLRDGAGKIFGFEATETKLE